MPAVEVASAKAQGATHDVQAVRGIGKIGGRSYIANDQEIQIPNFAGSGESAVIPTYGGGIEKAIAMIGSGKSGSILNRGYVPNFASVARPMNYREARVISSTERYGSDYSIRVKPTNPYSLNDNQSIQADIKDKKFDAG